MSIAKLISKTEDSFERQLNKLFKSIHFENFQELPKLEVYEGNKIVLIWRELEIERDRIIYIMETRGYIIPEDFI